MARWCSPDRRASSEVDLEAVPADRGKNRGRAGGQTRLPRGTTFGVFAAIRAWLADAAGQPLSLFPLPWPVAASGP
jgi:hypothetical protein